MEAPKRRLHLSSHPMHGEDVKAFQVALNGHLEHYAKFGAPAKLKADGWYGPATRSAYRWVGFYVVGFLTATLNEGAGVQAQRLIRDTSKLNHSQRARARTRQKKLSEHNAPNVGGKVGFPLSRRPSQVFGPGVGTHSWTAPPTNWESDNAVDLLVPAGTPVLAVADGEIGSQFGPLEPGGGRFAGIRLHLIVAEANGREWYYAHLRDTAHGVAPGAHVREGQLLGHSGVANGVGHLHIACALGYSKRNGRDVRRLLGV